MNRVKLSIRIPAEQETLIRHIAKVRGMTRYQALLRVIETGLASITGGSQVRSQLASDEALATIESRLAIIESLTDRSLFTASAAYGQAQAAGSRRRTRSEPDHHARRAAGQPWRAVAVSGRVADAAAPGPEAARYRLLGSNAESVGAILTGCRRFAARPRAGRALWQVA